MVRAPGLDVFILSRTSLNLSYTALAIYMAASSFTILVEVEGLKLRGYYFLFFVIL